MIWTEIHTISTTNSKLQQILFFFCNMTRETGRWKSFPLNKRSWGVISMIDIHTIRIDNCPLTSDLWILETLSNFTALPTATFANKVLSINPTLRQFHLNTSLRRIIVTFCYIHHIIYQGMERLISNLPRMWWHTHGAILVFCSILLICVNSMLIWFIKLIDAWVALL